MFYSLFVKINYIRKDPENELHVYAIINDFDDCEKDFINSNCTSVELQMINTF